MLRAPGNPVPGAAHAPETSALRAVAEPTSRIGAADFPAGASFFGAVMSEQPVMTTEAMTTAVTRSLERIIGVSPE
jgi:hypothetical protein